MLRAVELAKGDHSQVYADASVLFVCLEPDQWVNQQLNALHVMRMIH